MLHVGFRQASGRSVLTEVSEVSHVIPGSWSVNPLPLVQLSRVFVVNLYAYGPAFEESATNLVTLSEKEREGRERREAKRERYLRKGTREH